MAKKFYGDVKAGRKKIDHCRVDKASLYATKLLDVTVGLDRLEVAELADQHEVGVLTPVREQRVVEAGGSGGAAVRGEVDPAHTGPEGRGEAQRARLTAGVEHGAAEIEVGGRNRGRPDGHHFGVRRGIVVPRDPVDAFMDPPVGSDHQRAERPAAVGHTSGGEPDRLIEEAANVPS